MSEPNKFIHSGSAQLGSTPGSISKRPWNTNMKPGIRKSPIRFNSPPVVTMSITFMRPLENTMAFGGVAMGSIKAYELLRVAGIINKSGCCVIATASAAKIGANTVMVETLDVNSVINTTTKQITTNKKYKGNTSTNERC